MIRLTKEHIWHKSIEDTDTYADMVNMDKHLEVEITQIADNFVEAKMPVNEKTKQPFNILHGGASCVLAETVGSIGANLVLDNTKQIAVGLEINANHISSISEGFVYAKATPVHVGQSTSVWNIDIRDVNGKKTCFCRFTALNKDIK